LSQDEKWCIFMRYRHEKRAEPLIKELCQKEEGIMHAEKTVTKISRSYLKFAREMAAIKNEMETEAWKHQLIEDGRAEGLTEGRAEGQRENTLQIARNLLSEGSTPDFVQKITGLSIEEIGKLQA